MEITFTLAGLTLQHTKQSHVILSPAQQDGCQSGKRRAKATRHRHLVTRYTVRTFAAGNHRISRVMFTGIVETIGSMSYNAMFLARSLS